MEQALTKTFDVGRDDSQLHNIPQRANEATLDAVSIPVTKKATIGISIMKSYGLYGYCIV